jgi:hypothetical protein
MYSVHNETASSRRRGNTDDVTFGAYYDELLRSTGVLEYYLCKVTTSTVC